MMNSKKAKHLIRVGCLVALVLLSSQTYAKAENEGNNPPEKVMLYETPKTTIAPEQSEKKSLREKGSLFAPPPDGGEAVGEEAPVSGNEIIFFLMAAGVYLSIALNRKMSTNKINY